MSAALNALLRQTSIDDHDEILKQCNEILKQNKSDIQTQRIKIVALLKLDRFNDAVRVFEQGDDQLKQKAALEYAYALYKAGDTEKANTIVKTLGSREAQLLQAQIVYRLEDFATTSKLYESLSKDPQSEENDIRINLNASYAQLLWKRQEGFVKKTKPDREDLEGFETAYNAACMSIARGELGQAEVLLKRAKDLCNAAEGLSSEEKQGELLPILIQQLHVLHALGKSQDAEKIAGQITSEDVPDASTRYLSIINKTAASPISNPYLTQRKLESAPTLAVHDKLFGFQELLLQKNDLAIDLSCSKLEGIKRSTGKIISTSSSSSLDPKVNIASSANAAAHAQSQIGKQGLKVMLPLLEKRPTDIGLLMTVVQLYTSIGKNGAAIHVLEKFLKVLEQSKAGNEEEARFNSGIIAVLVSLYALEGRKSHTKDELSKASSFWKNKDNVPPGLLKAAGVSLLERGNPEDLKSAHEIFTRLNQSSQNDKVVKAGLAASTPISGSSKSTDTKFFTPVAKLISDIDIAALEQAGIPRSSQSTAAILKRKRPDPSSTKPRKKRIRKSKLPKDYNPDKKPDPERWLPLRDRSTYRPKGKKGKQKQSTATQGSNEKPSESTPSIEPSTVATGFSGGGNKAKKKKGKR